MITATAIENSLAHIKSHARNIHQCFNEIKTIKVALGNLDKKSREQCENMLLLRNDFIFLIDLLLPLMREDILKRPHGEFGEKDPMLYQNASTILLNLTYSDTVFVQYLILQNAIPTFISLALHSHILEIPEDALHILGNIIGDGTIKTFDEIGELGIYFCLVNLLKQVILKERNPSTIFLANIMFCFSNLARGTIEIGFLKKLPELMKVFLDVMYHPASSLDVLEYILFIFSSLNTNDDIQLLIEYNIVPKIFVMCSNMLEEGNVGTNAFCSILRIFGNLASGTTEQCQCILDLGVIPFFKQTLQSSTHLERFSYTVSANIFFTLSNVSRGTETQSSEIFDIIPELVDQYYKTQFRIISDGDKLRDEIAEIFIGYLTYKSSDRIYYAMKESHTVAFKILLRFLKDNNIFDSDSLFDCLSVLENIVNFEVKKEEQIDDFNNETVKFMYKTLFIEYSGPQILVSMNEKKIIPDKCREKVLDILESISQPHIPACCKTILAEE